MTHRTLVRALLTSAVLAAGILLAGCDSDQISLAQNAKANQPVTPKLLAAMVEKDMDLQSPMLVRLFKQEAELEIWKQDRSGRMALLKTYPICRWSGDLGPKVREGDRQAPEGFYSINPSQMNPQSAYYLSFNTGYPNAFDKALGRTGSQLMVHGDCSSRGCYAMTDEQIAEIYSLGRESFFGGQKAFQLQAYPFRMTPVNMAKHRNNPNMPFWKMIKEGYDHFEVTKQEPKVDFCEKKYVFDAVKAPNAVRDPVFDASAKCPAYVIPDEIASAVREKEQQDAAETSKLVSKGTPVARLNTGIDGGMNAIFASKIPEGNTGLSEGGDSQALQSMSLARAPGTIPGTVNPPRPNLAVQQEQPVVATTSSTTPSPTTRVASANASDKSEGFFSSFARKVGIGGAADATPAAAAPKPPAAAAAAPAKPKVAEAKPQSVVRVAPKAEPEQAAKPAPKPSVTDTAAAAPAPAATGTQLAGSAPVVQSNSFDTRFSAVK
ncbi:murein L,D-transpeptidase [Bradyrhizobium septentrionale]|uniref:Murein L,D-transpeptidase n=1 Tax=Bradyrhizobium septentrionale TaxID=1404411 RepID=A0A973VUF8_9BRAD|nr:murein L,D-transpeptidase family protein [Bradyrhizobium septentrionale]UGY19128.1 murein L,D-transpeptidase [Bradyrhizobium septentrionale]UGY27861.1 murein L,D-transpeptidase [Bradyrhizobium septentrionale]